jgi:hypothetical protein
VTSTIIASAASAKNLVEGMCMAMIRSWPLYKDLKSAGRTAVSFGSYQIDRNVNVAVGSFRVRTKLVRFIHQDLGDFPREYLAS